MHSSWLTFIKTLQCEYVFVHVHKRFFIHVHPSVRVHVPRVSRQTQLTVLSINTNFVSVLHEEEKVIFCSLLGGHFAEHVREQERETGGRRRRKEGVPCLCESTSTGFSCMK